MVKASFIPVRREKDGGVKGTLINLTQLSRLQKKMDGILTEMGESLHRGEIGAVPSFGAGYDRVCDWCDYKSVCGYEPGAPVRPIEKLTHAQSLERLEKEETRHAEREWTPDQKNAIEARGGTLLVSAAAGSGKRRCSVERVVQRPARSDKRMRC